MNSTKLTRRVLLKRGAAAIGGLELAKLGAVARAQAATGLGAAWRDAFLIGVAVSNRTLDDRIPEHLELIASEFDSVTAENAMKWGVIRSDDETWQWQRADMLVDFASEHDMHVVGHTLVWHSQIPPTVFVDAGGNALTRSALLGRMQQHIETLVGRYRGRVHAWDVVNEGIDEGNGWRRSSWHEIIGDDYMEQAFRLAHAADPDATLLYNDYNMHNPAKRAFLVDMIRDYLNRGVPIHGVGLQGHVGLDYPDIEEWERSIATYAEMGLEVHISELDVDVLPSPYQMSAEVTMWGLHDGISWKNDFPINGRTNYPLLFDRNLERKPAYHRLLALAQAEA